MLTPRAEELSPRKYIFLLDRKSPEQSEDLIKKGKKINKQSPERSEDLIGGKKKK